MQLLVCLGKSIVDNGRVLAKWLNPNLNRIAKLKN